MGNYEKWLAMWDAGEAWPIKKKLGVKRWHDLFEVIMGWRPKGGAK